MRGHTKIELKDVDTGKVTVHEEDNLVTNMYPRLWTPFGDAWSFGNYCVSNNYEFWDKAIGGVILLRDNLDEDPEITMAPASISCTGSAGGSKNAGLNTMLGSYNMNESEHNQKSIKKVWDFTTDQANGTIGCICLTSDDGGMIGQGCVNKDDELIVDYKASISKNGIAVDVANPNNMLAYAAKNTAYFFDIYNLVYNAENAYKYARATKKLLLKKVYIPIEAYSVGVKSKNEVMEEIEIDIPSELANSLSSGSSNLYGSISYDEGNIYLFLNDSMYIEAGATFYVVKIAVNDFGLSASLITLTNTTGKLLTAFSFNTDFHMNNQYVDNSYLYTFAKDSKNAKENYLYRINLKNSTDVSRLKDAKGNEIVYVQNSDLYNVVTFENSQEGYVRICQNRTSSGYLYFEGPNYLINKQTGVVLNEEINISSFGGNQNNFKWSRVFRYIGNDAIALMVSPNKILPFIRPNYLFTINNINPKITKTASQIMKITYTLTEN